MRTFLLSLMLVACSAMQDPSPAEPSTPATPSTSNQAVRSVRVRLLRSLPPFQRYWPVECIESIGDWDGDGISDLAVSNPDSVNKDTHGNPYGAAGMLILSSRDGRRLAALLGAPEIVYSPTMWRWERRFTALGDIDSDRRVDVALLSSGMDASGASVAELSAFGASREKPIWTQQIEVPGDCMPFVLQRLGDLDHDGTSDLAVGMPSWTATKPTKDRKIRMGWIEARSGKDGRLLWRIQGPQNRVTGWELARYADADRDGVEDVAVLTLNDDASPASPDQEQQLADFESMETLPARIEIRSGASGALLPTAPKVEPRINGSWQSPTPYHMRGGEDIDGDSVTDLAVRIVRDGEINAVQVFSGGSGDVVARMTPHPDPNGREEYSFPSAIAIASDIDGDGWRDLLLGHDEVGTEQGYDWGAIYVQSTRTNELLAAVWGTEEDSKLGIGIAWIGDTDGDGTPEFAALTTQGIKIWAIERDESK